MKTFQYATGEIDIYRVATYVLISVFILVIIGLIEVNIIDATISPIVKKLGPSENQTTGITQDVYNQKISNLENVGFWVMIILVAVPFVYLVVKLFYQREYTTY